MKCVILAPLFQDVKIPNPAIPKCGSTSSTLLIPGSLMAITTCYLLMATSHKVLGRKKLFHLPQKVRATVQTSYQVISNS
jgi:hypothetical protein